MFLPGLESLLLPFDRDFLSSAPPLLAFLTVFYFFVQKDRPSWFRTLHPELPSREAHLKADTNGSIFLTDAAKAAEIGRAHV